MYSYYNIMTMPQMQVVGCLNPDVGFLLLNQYNDHADDVVGCSNPDVGFLSGPWTGFPAGRGFLSGRGLGGSIQNWRIFIRIVLRHVRKFGQFLSGLSSGCSGDYWGSSRPQGHLRAVERHWWPGHVTQFQDIISMFCTCAMFPAPMHLFPVL